MGKKNRKNRPQAEKFKAGELSRGARNLAKAIQSTKITQAAAARAMDIHPGFLSHMLRGRKAPSRTMAIKIRDTFGVAIEAWDE